LHATRFAVPFSLTSPYSSLAFADYVGVRPYSGALILVFVESLQE